MHKESHFDLVQWHLSHMVVTATVSAICSGAYVSNSNVFLSVMLHNTSTLIFSPELWIIPIFHCFTWNFSHTVSNSASQHYAESFSKLFPHSAPQKATWQKLRVIFETKCIQRPHLSKFLEFHIETQLLLVYAEMQHNPCTKNYDFPVIES